MIPVMTCTLCVLSDRNVAATRTWSRCQPASLMPHCTATFVVLGMMTP